MRLSAAVKLGVLMQQARFRIKGFAKKVFLTTKYGLIMALSSLLTPILVGPTAASATETPPVILALGDSLTAGYRLPPEEAFPAQLQDALQSTHPGARVINAGISGDTTSGGLSRLDWALFDNPDIVIVELGANDALRGLPVDLTRQNLEAILSILQERGIVTLLTGMYAPPNMGPDYAEAFNSIYPDLAEQYNVALYPFFLEGVAADPTLNKADGIHPTAEGVAVIVDNILPSVHAVLDQL